MDKESKTIRGLDCCAWFGLVLLALMGVLLVVCNLPPQDRRSDPDVEAGRLVRLTRTSGTELDPAWSPDGNKIAYECYSDGDVMSDGQVSNRTISSVLYSSICIMNADGTGRERLTELYVDDFDPAWSPNGSKIAFASRGGIYVMNVDGSGIRRVTSGDSWAAGPSWSPDGSQIAFSWHRDGQTDIYAINVDGSGLKQVTDDGFYDKEPAWSPDGARIAFASAENRTSDIYLINLDGSERTLLYGTVRNERSPAWSPDGSTIAFTSEERPDGGNLNDEIFKINLDLSGFARLTNRGWDDETPSWNPYGDKLVFSSNQVGNSEIYVMEADTPTVRLRATPTPHVIPLPTSTVLSVPPHDPYATPGPDPDVVAGKLFRLTRTWGAERDPAWSPVGDKIAFECVQDGQFANEDEVTNGTIQPSQLTGDICVMNADGSGRVRLTDDQGDDSDPAWSPGGGMIAFSSRRGGQRDIYVMSTDGSGLKRVTDDAPDDTGPTWSPDGDKIAFSSTRNGNTDIYVIDVDGAGIRRLTSYGAWEIEPAWSLSPDPWEIAYTIGSEEGTAIKRVDPDREDSARSFWSHGNSRSPAWSPDGISVAFSGESDSGSREIWTFNVDQYYAGDREAERLTNRSLESTEPSWSPDGSRIVFASNEVGNWELYIMVVHDPQYQRLTDNTRKDSEPVWSPDGGRVAYVSGRDGDREIFIVDADGAVTRQLTNNDYADFGPAWSPDGSRIAYVAHHGEGQREVIVVDEDGSNAVKLTGEDEVAFPHFDGTPSWSPDGKRLAFASQISGRYQHHIVNSDGTQRESYSIGGQCPVRSSAWAPDGSMILFTCGDRNIYLLDLSNGEQTSYYCGNRVLESHSWSPDSTRFAYACEDSAGIYIFDPPDRNRSGGQVCYDQVLSPSWSRDGTEIAFICKDGPIGDIWTFNIDDRTETRVTYERSNQESVSWSPVGDKIVFASDKDGDFEIYVVDVER